MGAFSLRRVVGDRRHNPTDCRFRCYTRAGMKRSIAWLFGLLMVTSLFANQDGIVVRSATIYADAGRGAARVGRLEAGTPVQIFDRKGGWREIYSEEKAIIGWARTYEVREVGAGAAVPAQTQSDSRGFLDGLALFSRKASRFFTGSGAATSAGTATIGVRGLSEAELKSAQPDLQQLERMRSFASNAARSAQFGATGGLRARKVKHLEARADDDRGAGSGRDK